MDWNALTWMPPAGAGLEAASALAGYMPEARVAVESAVGTEIMGTAHVDAVAIARIAGAELPVSFMPLATIGLLGAQRRNVMVALDPGDGDELGGLPLDAGLVGGEIIKSLDDLAHGLTGEGLGVGAADPLAFSSGAALILIRVGLASDDRSRVSVVLAVEEAVVAELARHLATIDALGDAASLVTAPAAAAAQPAYAAPVAQPAVMSQPASPVQATPVARVAPAATAPAQLLAHPDLAAAIVELASGGQMSSVAPGTAEADHQIRAAVLPELTASPSAPRADNGIELLLGVNLQVTVEIGRARMPIRDVLALTPGSIVELDKLAGEKVDVLVNGRLIASGEVVVVDENFGVRITDIVARPRRVLSADHAA